MVGCQFEKMVDLMRQYLNKTAGKANLSLTLNNRPLNYLEDDIQFPVLTSNTLVYGEETFNLEETINLIEGDLRKSAKYIKKCKDNKWNRWKGEYLKSL